MKTDLMRVALVAGAVCATQAFAQSRGEADPPEASRTPVVKVTAAEKQAARDMRRREGAVVARNHPMGDDQPSTTAKRPRAPLEERQAASTRRKAEMTAAGRRGELSFNAER